jgi:hypothetical protein
MKRTWKLTEAQRREVARMYRSAATAALGGRKDRAAGIWEREANEHYVEAEWCSVRLFDEEEFGAIHDPCCGFGRIVKSAWSHGLSATGADLIDRGFEKGGVADFFGCDQLLDCVVCNPPFNRFQDFALHALKLSLRKVAMIWQVPRLNAAGGWLKETPLRRIWFMTPRPSMPPGCVVSHGVGLHGEPQKVGGGTQDFCWLVWEHGYVGHPEVRWLHRDAT